MEEIKLSGEQIMVVLETMDKTTTSKLNEVLLALKGTTGPSTPTPNLNKALAAAQKSFPTPKKTKEAKVEKDGRLLYKFMYADLSDVIDAVREPLAVNQISFTQTTERSGSGWDLVTRLLHESGEQRETRLPLQLASVGRPQELGSILTFYRRYELSGILGVASEMDDDANISMGNDAVITDKKPKTKPKTEDAPKEATSLSSAQVAEIKALAAQRVSAGWTVERVKEYALVAFNVDSPAKLHPSKLTELMDPIRTMTADEAISSKGAKAT